VLMSMKEEMRASSEPAAKAMVSEEQDKLPAKSHPLSERVAVTVGMILRRKDLFRQYARDIRGRTGIGAIAALAYCKRVVERREKVWGDLVMIVMERKQREVEEVVLRAVGEVLSPPIKEEEWVWLRDNLLSTYLWFARSSLGRHEYLWQGLLEVARKKLELLAEEADAMQFPALEDVRSEVFILGDEASLRQDHELVGVRAGLEEETLGGGGSSQFYDLNVYLNELLCIARLLDQPFQQHFRLLSSSLSSPALVLPGPPKSLARCRAKAQVDYRGMRYPSSAHLLDVVRTTWVVQDEESLLEALELLLASQIPLSSPPSSPLRSSSSPTPSSPSGHTVVRVKNGFRRRGGYRDVKINVVFSSLSGFRVIGEVALVLSELKDYKDKTHELYEILREEEFFSQVTNSLLLHGYFSSSSSST